jgi:hypothetical protein
MGKKRHAYRIVGKALRSGHLEDREWEERITLTCILGKYGVRMWGGWKWHGSRPMRSVLNLRVLLPSVLGKIYSVMFLTIRPRNDQERYSSQHIVRCLELKVLETVNSTYGARSSQRSQVTTAHCLLDTSFSEMLTLRCAMRPRLFLFMSCVGFLPRRRSKKKKRV